VKELVEGGLRYPRWKWPASSWFLTAIGTFVALALVIFPGMTGNPWAQRIVAAFMIVFLTTLPVCLPYVVRVSWVFCRRALHWGAMLNVLKELSDKLDITQNVLRSLLQERRERNAYRIAYCYDYQDRTFIALKNRPGPTVHVGARVIVVDEEIIGEFKTIEEVDGYYRCEKDGYIDALWLGSIKKSGSQHSEAPPEARAYVVAEMKDKDDE